MPRRYYTKDYDEPSKFERIGGGIAAMGEGIYKMADVYEQKKKDKREKAKATINFLTSIGAQVPDKLLQDAEMGDISAALSGMKTSRGGYDFANALREEATKSKFAESDIGALLNYVTGGGMINDFRGLGNYEPEEVSQALELYDRLSGKGKETKSTGFEEYESLSPEKKELYGKWKGLGQPSDELLNALRLQNIQLAGLQKEKTEQDIEQGKLKKPGNIKLADKQTSDLVDMVTNLKTLDSIRQIVKENPKYIGPWEGWISKRRGGVIGEVIGKNPEKQVELNTKIQKYTNQMRNKNFGGALTTHESEEYAKEAAETGLNATEFLARLKVQRDYLYSQYMLRKNSLAEFGYKIPETLIYGDEKKIKVPQRKQGETMEEFNLRVGR